MTLPTDLYDIPVLTIHGKETTLKPYQGKLLLIVNVASRCGFTPQYKALQQLHDDYQDKGMTVLGFPCDQFFHQEPGSDADIHAFASSCFRVMFPLFAKLNVKNPHQSPLYAYLAQHIEKKPWICVPWNFTKILVDKEGRVLKRYWPFTSFKKIRKDLDRLLAQ
jgi:glutathione peroxidase